MPAAPPTGKLLVDVYCEKFGLQARHDRGGYCACK